MIAIVIGISGCTDLGAGSSGTTPAEINANATTVTAAQLYNDKGTLVGKPVKMKGEIMQTGDTQILVTGIKMSYDTTWMIILF